MIRKLGPWVGFLLAALVCVEAIEEETRDKPLSFSIYAWPYKNIGKSAKLPSGKIDPVRFLPEFRYRDGDETHSVQVLPGRQSKRLHYTDKSPLTLYRARPENNATEIAAAIRLDPRWQDVLFILYPKDAASRTYHHFPIDRSIAAQTAGAAVVGNLTRINTLVEVNGVKSRLSPSQVSLFNMQRKGVAFTRFQVSVETDKGWSVVHSSKRYLSKRSGTVFLLSPVSGSGSGTRLKVITLSPPR